MIKVNMPRHFLLALITFFSLGLSHASGQNLIYNGDITLGAAGWTTSCVNVECYGFETTYGGPSATNHVAEIDDQACMHQDVCVLPGYSFTFSMDASVRTGGGPNPCTSHIKITGLDVGGVAVATYVDMDYVRTNTVFALTPVTGIPVFTVASGSGVIRVRVELTDNTPGFLTLGMIVDNISLTYVAGPTAGAPMTTCQGVPLSFSVAGAPAGLTYYWLFGSGATPASSTLASPLATWSIPGSFTVKVALGNGTCNDTINYPVTITPSVTTPIFVTTCNQPYMFGGVLRTVSGVYSDTATAAGGCDSIVLLSLTINPRPIAPAVIPVSYCQFDLSAPLSATGLSLTWYGPGVTGPLSTAPAPTTSVAGRDTFYVTQTVLGCSSDSAMVIATIKPQPAPPIARDTAYCQFQQSVQLSATGAGVQWFTTALGGTALASAPVPSTMFAGINRWYAGQVVNGCPSARTAVNVTVASVPVFTITSDHISVCINDTVKLSYSGAGAVSGYSWTIPQGYSLLAGTLASTPIYIKATVSGPQNIYLKVADTSRVCSAIDTLPLNVVPTPSAEINTPNGVCLGDTLTLALGDRSLNADSFFWYIDNTPLLASPYVNILSRNAHTGGPFTISWNTSGQHLITMYTITKEGCRSEWVADSIKVNNLPNANFSILARGKLCLEDSVNFQAQQTGYGFYYVWSPAEFFNNINAPYTWGKMREQNSIVSLRVADAYGCSATTSQQLQPALCCRIDIPSAFTPNGDGLNDVFSPVVSGYHIFHKFSIVNRWGQVIFESGGSNFQWDGNYNGVPQDMGVYYYMLSYDCGGNVMMQKGDVTLIR
jgi:gliding motility-associated-like protein